MVSVTQVTPTARNIEITAESLQEDLVRLEIQKQALERELAAVSAHLASVRLALGAFQSLVTGASASASDAGREDARPVEPAPTQSTAVANTPEDAGESRAPAALADVDTASGKTYGKLTEQILAYFADAGDVDVRARDVASALGRDTDSGSINAVRSTLDRLVGTSRIRRTGRGLYRAVKP
ncbi:hypothetical protein [Streptomyces sp. TLI_185]|uniref:hypothetical protein n=1 Tax=Streptomyces sp. TLI_185 TaxID=2485151 RepID=UPI000F4D7844|nr:hypothetical protein [Streptomyces sp. TLI_185]RPF30474.1 hypothetical protein EDD92_0249 [Streptomyces sp. TLI_185]